MTDIIKEMTSLLKDKSLQYTLGKDALEEMLSELKSLNRKVKSQEKEITSTMEALEAAHQEVKELSVKLRKAEDTVHEYESRESSLRDRELNCETLEIIN